MQPAYRSENNAGHSLQQGICEPMKLGLYDHEMSKLHMGPTACLLRWTVQRQWKQPSEVPYQFPLAGCQHTHSSMPSQINEKAHAFLRGSKGAPATLFLSLSIGANKAHVISSLFIQDTMIIPLKTLYLLLISRGQLTVEPFLYPLERNCLV